jgi:hypothetical protein
VVIATAANPAFYVVFSVFVLALVALTVVSVRWAVRRDRTGRVAWEERRRARTEAPPAGTGDGGEGPGASR